MVYDIPINNTDANLTIRDSLYHQNSSYSKNIAYSIGTRGAHWLAVLSLEQGHKTDGQMKK